MKTNKYIPFLNHKDMINWKDRNCANCTTECINYVGARNLSNKNGMTIEAAEFIGYKSLGENYIGLHHVCRHKNKYKKPKKVEINDNQMKMF